MLQWADTFNRYGTDATLLLNGIYSAYSGVLAPDPDPSATGNVYELVSNSSQDGLRFAYPNGAAATMGFQCLLWLSQLPIAFGSTGGFGGLGWCINDVNNAIQFYVEIGTTGALIVYRGPSPHAGTVIGQTTIPVISANSWNHIEYKYTINSTTGSVEIRVNGNAALTLTGVNNQSSALASSAQINFINCAVNPIGVIKASIKNLAVWDTTGTRNNTFLGLKSMTDIDTDSDVSLTWAPSTGTTGYSILDNNPPLDDAAYISAATALSNTFGLKDLPADTTSVSGIILINRSKKVDGGDGSVQMGIISGASTGLGSNHSITTAYTYWHDVMETDPATGLPFTPTGFNAAKLKLDRTV